jgi:hypothetical protein
MGNWAVIIEGVGCHHNGQPYDIEAVVGRTLDDLEKSGHTVNHVQITTGGTVKPVRVPAELKVPEGTVLPDLPELTEAEKLDRSVVSGSV